jgi:hypothetical protein
MAETVFQRVAREERGRVPTRTVVFIREGMFYPLTLPVTDNLATHARYNPGTLRIEDPEGNVLWSPASPLASGEAK